MIRSNIVFSIRRRALQRRLVSYYHRTFRSHKVSSPPSLTHTIHQGLQVRSRTGLCEHRRYNGLASNNTINTGTRISKRHLHLNTTSKTSVKIDGEDHEFSTILLRDLCQCPLCVHEFTGQKLYSTSDIPPHIEARTVTPSELICDTVELLWNNDVSGFDASHKTTLKVETLKAIVTHGTISTPLSTEQPRSTPWSIASSGAMDFDYRAYMDDDKILLQVIQHLQAYGLVFIIGVPGIELSVASIAERIGPVKDTFYGRTWDVRTVPKAINAAYTSNDLGFHTDLLYFDHPPHIQLLHCIQSSSSGGASLFADAFKCAQDLYASDEDAFNILATTPVNYHYTHPDSNIYRTTKPVFDMRPLRIGQTTYTTLSEFLSAWQRHRLVVKQSTGLDLPAYNNVVDCLEKINWGPPFMAPFSLQPDEIKSTTGEHHSHSLREALNDKVDAWHAAARKFSALLQGSTGLYERLMKPGECVLFNNTRVLHSRRAFDSNDTGKARWLRGAYVDKDPFFSKLRVLEGKFGKLP